MWEGGMRYQRAWVMAVFVLVTMGGMPARAQEPIPSPLERLKAGNERFVKDAAAAMPITAEKRIALAKGQAPFAIVLSCADSRVPPEVIFNAGLGDLFIVRTAGEVADKAVLASVEYGAEHLNAPLLVVMGHDSCGAVKAAIETKPGAASMGPNLDALIAAIKPGFARMKAPPELENLRDAILANVEQVINDLFTKSTIIKHLVDGGKLQAVGAYYEFASGRVRFSESVKPAASAEHK
jgi:carbonic anhydrase